MKSYFSKHYSTVKYPKQHENKIGLRNAQIGAIHAISSFFTLQQNRAAIIVMPTGAGKTSVLMMSPYVLESKKALVITPSVLVRGQVEEDFSTLKTLCKANVFQDTVAKPKIFEMKNKYDEQFYNKIKEADIVIATPICALSLSRVDEVKKLFDLVLVDEAHHSPATTWEEILVNMDTSKHILFTATPFRLDKKEIRGDIIYSYPLSRAYQDGIFGEIEYIPLDVCVDKDTVIAEMSEKVFLTDKENGFNHYIMVRTNSKKHAEELSILYAEKTQLRLKKIDSSMSNLSVKKVIEELKSGFLDGIICVDMLGEGFDFPNLKIAAIHSPHKSLGNTLQFIGRFARTNADNIGTAKFIAMRDDELIIENNKLYSSDAVWKDMIIDMSENKSNTEASVKQYFNSYERIDEVPSTLTDDFSLHNICLNCHAKIYEISGFNLYSEFPLICKTIEGIMINKKDNTVIVIGKEYVTPKWSCSEDLYDMSHMLFIIHFQKSTNLLFIYSQLKTEFVYEQIAKAYSSTYLKVPKSKIHHVLGELSSFEIFNSGMLNRNSNTGETYRIMAGSDVSKSIEPTTGKMFSPGHVFCKAEGTDGMITIGYSSGSKMWSSSYYLIPEYIRWCDYNGSKIANQNILVKTNTNFDLLPVSTLLKQYPDNIFMWDFSGDTYITPPIFSIEQKGNYKSTLLDADIKILTINQTFISLSVRIESVEEEITCDSNGAYSSKSNLLKLKEGRREIPLTEYFNHSPLNFRTSDDTLITGNEVNKGDPNAIAFDQKNILNIDWKKYKTDVKKEIDGNNSIQSTLRTILIADARYNYIIYDHSSGEMADFITIQETLNSIEVSFYHVKGMSASNYNSSVSDIYEVAGQAVKSLIWVKNKQTLINKIRKRRKVSKCKFEVGNYKDLLITMKQNKPLVGRIIVVQPSISKSVFMPEKIQEVLGASRYYIMNSGSVVSFNIWGSK
ncbi:DEAD/DEAH box helicase [Clostridium sp.]